MLEKRKKMNKTHLLYNKKMAQMGVENDVIIHFTSYRSFFESCKIIFTNLVMHYIKKGGFSTTSCPILIIKSVFSMHTCT
jgi:hypothetical protein